MGPEVRGRYLILVACLLAPVGLNAADATPQEAGREIGAILAWRLGPEAVEEHCRAADPDGAGMRKQALNAWFRKNEALIKEVDTRVAEIVPLLQRPSPGVDPVGAVRDQVKKMLIESAFEGKTPEETTTLCKAEAVPDAHRWNNNGMPHVQQSLAALNDWQVRRGENQAQAR